MSGLSMSAKLRLGNQSLLTAGMLVFMAQAHADSISALIAQKSARLMSAIRPRIQHPLLQ